MSVFPEMFPKTVSPWDFPIQKQEILFVLGNQPGMEAFYFFPALCLGFSCSKEILLLLSPQIFPQTYLTVEPKEQQSREASFNEILISIITLTVTKDSIPFHVDGPSSL